MNGLHRDTVLQSLPRPTVLLDTDFVIRAVNKAYLTATTREADELVDVPMFDAFSDNPDDPDANGVANLNRSLERAARFRRPDHMIVQRYDILHSVSGEWVLRHWSPTNTPVVEDDHVVALLHQVVDVTPFEDLRRAMEACRPLVDEDRHTDADDRSFAAAARAFVETATTYQSMAAEITHLRRALTSRGTIDQAKGIIMAEQGCTPEAAFDSLARLSQDTNVRLVDVAAALVYRAQASTTQD